MKNIALLYLLITIFSITTYAQNKGENNLNSHLIVNFFTNVRGTMKLEGDNISFYPKQRTNENSTIDKYLLKKNHLICPINLSVSDIKKVSPRNYLLIFPNRFLIETNNGNKYKFYSYKRRKVISFFRERKR